LAGSARSALEVPAGSEQRFDRDPDIRGSVLVDGAPPQEPIDLELKLFGTLLVDGAPAVGPIDRERFLDDAGVLDWSGHEREGGTVRKLVTDDGGRFEVFAAGIGTVFTLRAPGYLLASEGSAIWATPSRLTPELDLVLHLRTPPAIRGRVLDADGRPVPGAHGVHHLSATASGWSLEPGREDFDCDGEGRFEIALLGLMWEGMPKMRGDESCSGTLLFEVPRIGRALVETGPFRSEDLDLGDIVLEPVRVLPFRVRDERGAPLQGAVARLDDTWLTRASNPTNREGLGELRHVPERAIRVRFSALGYADRALSVGLGDEPEVWLDPTCQLDLQLEPLADTYGTFPDIVLTARDVLLERTDAPASVFNFDRNWIQTELGATARAETHRWKDAEGMHEIARFQPDAGGKVVISGLRPDVSFTLEACDATGRVLARRELALARGERKRLALPYGE
jgi:hypothetical protein